MTSTSRTRARRPALPAFVRLVIGSVALAPCAPAMAQTSGPGVAPAAITRPVPQYRVGTGDELEVFVWGEERMQRTVRVQSDGTFAFPLAGTIRAEGRNVSDISTDIRERISTNYRSAPPDVTVSVRTASEMRFYVVGKVRQAGSYTSSGNVNVLQALSMAGGAAEFADLRNAVILRQRPDGAQTVEPVALTTFLKGRRGLRAGALATALPTLGGGDVLVIP
ncbi:polysaccharide biosynthesis/export family protein [Sphingomonas sp. IW22]